MCGAEKVTRYRPFCSKRCADLDLGSWLGGHYRIPTDEEADLVEFPGQNPENEEYQDYYKFKYQLSAYTVVSREPYQELPSVTKRRG